MSKTVPRKLVQLGTPALHLQPLQKETWMTVNVHIQKELGISIGRQIGMVSGKIGTDLRLGRTGAE